MSSRDLILATIKSNNQLLVGDKALPEFKSYVELLSREDKIKLFTQNLEANKAWVKNIDTTQDVSTIITAQWPGQQHIHAPSLPYVHNAPGMGPHGDKVDVAVIHADLGVCNNGALWIHDQHLEHRQVPFLCTYLVVIIDADDLVYNLHEAYAKLDPASFDYGVWISGPSKTGDIEQALVIGAHGPIEMMVIVR